MSSRPRANLRELLGPLVRPHARGLALVGSLSFIGALIEALVLLAVARSAFALTEGNETVSVDLGPLGNHRADIGWLLGVAALAAAIRVAFHLLAVWRSSRIAGAVLNERRDTVIRLYYEASWELQSRERQGHVQEMLTQQAQQAAGLLDSLSSAMVSALSLAALLGAALVVAPIASVAAITAVVILALALRPLRARARATSKLASRRGLDFATALTELVDMAREVRLFRVADTARARLDRLSASHSYARIRARNLTGAVPALYQGAALLSVIVALVLVSELDLAGLAALGGVVLIMLRSLSYGQALQTSYQALLSGAPYVENIRADEDRYRASAVPREGAAVDGVGRLEFRGVSFEYEPGRPVLRNLGFVIERGEIVGIVGPSGSGKSTLVQLMLRLRTPTDGVILADGRDVQSLALDDWYRSVAYVPQEPRLLAGTVAENIAFLRDTDDAEITRAATLAHLHEDVLSWPDGYATPVGERGGQLSGGQRQRLCIARALVGDPELVVLDEPTSALDAHSEALVRQTLFELVPEKTVMIIAHRLSTLAMCDRIMVLSGGEIQGFDAPDTLEASSDFYREALRLSGLR